VTHAFGEAIPIELVAIVERATASDPARRYPSVEDLADDLRRFLRGEAVVARPDTHWQKAVRTVARHRQAAALVVLGFALVSMATIAGLLWRHDRAIQAQRVREQRIQAWVKDVADQGDRLQMRLLDVQGKFEALAAGLAHASQFGQALRVPLTWVGDASPASAGDHLDGAFDVLPGASRAAVEPLARQLVTLRRSEDEIFEVVGRALGRAAAPGDAPRTSSSEAVLKLPLADMARDENENDTGVFETDRLGGTHLVAYDRIHPIEWTLVAIVDARDLFR
jgi:hypothetical protein